jgi:hypothetical protein
LAGDRSRTSNAWLTLDALVWLVGLALAATRTVQWTHGGPFALVLGLFALYRLASACTLLRVDELGVHRESRWDVVATWLFFGRSAANGAFLVSFSLVGIATHPHVLGIVLGVIGLLVGQAFLVFGIGLLRDVRRAEIEATGRAPES